MYDLVMEKEDAGILPDALDRAMKLRKMSAAELARKSGVHKTTISMILSGDRPNTPATIVAKLARALNVSMDFLMGITDDPEPRSLGVGPVLIQLTEVAKVLPDSRQHDLLLIAQTYADNIDETTRRVLGEVRDMLFEAADEAGRGRELDGFLQEQLDNMSNAEDGDGDNLESPDDQENDKEDRSGSGKPNDD